MDRILSVVLLGLGLLTNSAVSAVTYSGTISLPAGITAGPGGAEFDVSTVPVELFVDGNNFLQTSSDTVVIPPFGTSGSYSFEFPPSPNYSDHRMTFDCETGCEFIDATTTGYWSNTLGVVSILDATEYVPTQDRTINILLENADSFNGVIHLPEGFSATDEELIVIHVSENAQFSFESYTTYLFPESGESSFPFTIGVPTSAAASSWTLEFSCFNCDTEIEEVDHFPTTATGDPSTLNESDQYIFPKSSDYPAMSMTFFPVITNSEPSPITGALYLLLDD